MIYVNLTPHTINLNDGRSFPPSGKVSRVSSHPGVFEDDCCDVVFGDVQDLPEPVDGVRLIVSGMVASRVPGRKDVVSPATGHPDCVRENGQVKSVPGFIRS